jgi:hypothetical protein
MSRSIIFFFFLLSVLNFKLLGQTRIISTGNWSATTTWQGGDIGDALAEDVITDNSIRPVTVDGNYQIGNFTFGNDIRLVVANGSILEVGDDLDNDDATGITHPRDIETKNNAEIDINTGGTLIIYGNLIVNNNITLNVNGNLIIKGNVDLKNDANFNVSGSVNVNGDFLSGNNTNVTVNNGGSVNVDGNVDVGSGNLNTNGTGVFTAGTCDPNTPANFCNNVTLPIELKSFTASKSNQDIHLNWVTAKEENFSHFEIERSVDQNNWEQIGLVQGLGESNSDVHYDFTDRDAPFGMIYYRLKSVDIDATFEYSPVVKVEVGFEGKLAISPNPVKDAFNLKILLPSEFKEDLAYVGLFDLSGMKIQEFRNFNTDATLQIDQKLKSGLYILKVNHNGLQENIRVVVQ